MKSYLRITTSDINTKFVLVLFCLMVVFGFNSCNKEPDKFVREVSIYRHYKVDELINEKPHLDKTDLIDRVISVEGIIKDINEINNRHTVILKGNKNKNTLVICDLQTSKNKNSKNYNLGDTITVKGILKGSLKDFILLNCVITN